ncbi:hypothetical protein IMZ48_24315 [Candidatus Bathyarchaeota archaeon]|nr:hypothetical protein [Candidatus Bathyarchaeota archaeon]
MAPASLLRFPTAGFQTMSDSVIIEEEQVGEFKAGRYYPVNIGDVYHGKVQVVGKLGFGTTSTVWLAWDQGTVCFGPVFRLSS